MSRSLWRLETRSRRRNNLQQDFARDIVMLLPQQQTTIISGEFFNITVSWGWRKSMWNSTYGFGFGNSKTINLKNHLQSFIWFRTFYKSIRVFTKFSEVHNSHKLFFSESGFGDFLNPMSFLLNPDFTAKRIHELIAQFVITGPADVTARRKLSHTLVFWIS